MKRILVLVAFFIFALPVAAFATLRTAVDEVAAGMMTSAGQWFSDFAPLLFPILGALVFMLVAGAFVGWLRGRNG